MRNLPLYQRFGHHRAARVLRSAALLAAVATVAPPVGGQTMASAMVGVREWSAFDVIAHNAPPSALNPSVRDIQGQSAPVPAAPVPVTWRDGRILGGFALAATAIMSSDGELRRLMQRRWVQESPLFSHGADVFNAYGSPGVFVGSVGMYAAGWATGDPKLARLGMRTGEAIMLSGIITGGIKGFAGRARPFASPDNPRDFRLLSGTHDGARQSFPSGHTTAVFAFASAMDRELRISHPDAARWASPALYTAAALTGLARMHSDNHWASDVVMGAGIGLVSGLVVARFHADRPRHWIDQRFLPRARE